MNFRMIKHTVGWLLLFEAGFLCVPLLTAAVYGERELAAFLLTIGICVVLSLLLLLVGKPTSNVLYAREGFVIVSLCWIVLSIFGALPFMLSGVT